MPDLTIFPDRKLGTIAPEIYGQFSEHLGRGIYEGIYVGEESDIPNAGGIRSDVVEALKELQVPVLRWPGGCFADEYHWKDGVGPQSERSVRINSSWGGVREDNRFGTHEYMELCRQIGCRTYVNGNMGSGTVQEMSEWLEYMTSDGDSPMTRWRRENGREKPWKVDYFGVGNENWGCGGNMTPEFYGNMYRRYQTFLRSYGAVPMPKKVACGADSDDYSWTQRVLETCFDHAPSGAHGFMDLLSFHYYVFPDGMEHKGTAREFDSDGWYRTLAKAVHIEELIERHGAILDQFDPDKKIGFAIDEWGVWHDAEPGTNPAFLYQQNTVRDALAAGLTLNIFNHHCDRVKLACIAQMVNVIQSMILTEGPRMVRTPNYHIFHLFRHHQGAELLQTVLSGTGKNGTGRWQVPSISESASIKDGVITVTLVNTSLDCGEDMTIAAAGGMPLHVREARILAADDVHACNTFEEPDRVAERNFADYQEKNGVVTVHMPAASAAMICLQTKEN